MVRGFHRRSRHNIIKYIIFIDYRNIVLFLSPKREKLPLIRIPIDQNPYAQSLRPMDMMRQGWLSSLRHASQQ